MEFEQIDKSEFSRIQPLWEKLNKLHMERSNNFKAHFESFKFEDRIKQVEYKEFITVFLAKKGSDIVGYCMASISDGIGEIDSIYINPDCRGEKLGAKLLARAESWFTSKGVIKFHLSVAEGNESVFEFYNKHGYQKKCTVLEKKI